MRRKIIDEFLVELDKFLGEFPEYNIVFTPIFKAYRNNRTSLNKSDIKLPNLVHFCNLFASSKGVNSTKRTEYYVRNVAYTLEYKEVRDFSYREIFMKMVVNDGFITPTYTIRNHGKLIPKTLIIPEDYYHNDNIYIYEDNPNVSIL